MSVNRLFAQLMGILVLGFKYLRLGHKLGMVLDYISLLRLV